MFVDVLFNSEYTFIVNIFNIIIEMRSLTIQFETDHNVNDDLNIGFTVITSYSVHNFSEKYQINLYLR